MPKVLVTGFEPFDGEAVNPAFEAMQALNGKTIKGYEVIGKGLPVVFGESRELLKKWLDEVEPDIVISVGLAGGRYAISVERVAINIDDARIPDNKGRQPVDEVINPSGPAAYWSKLPIKAIVKEIREAGIPAEVSQTAGTYVCNHIFYGLMDYLAQKPGVRGGFIHIPFIPAQVADKLQQPSLHLDDIIRGLEIAIAATITYEKDIVEAGGTVS
ncbi:pyrrolidone-carboxylate peptidase [Pullulanibacillus camelliae]|uniref:Pyrrolidone-carboxylate peptidase n=1 Tax=Pullulanibacillus camelliae TaxID=1707096 RepID=A0A8J2VHU9_9BACL|nr:pyroglutamyl-peptidase I [Pullulanibacillus camelliae]GGE26686.1 pyrrolidone-carboxylate peptidase [Pullulanibacillus camelliae]